LIKKKQYLVTLALVSSIDETGGRELKHQYLQSAFFGPDGSSGQLAVKHATGAATSLFGVSRRGHFIRSAHG